MKKRLFVDMDGTLAVFHPVNRIETLYQKGYFLNLEPMGGVLLAVKQIIVQNPNIEVNILSAYLSDSQYALEEKLYLYTAIAPVPLSAFAGKPSQSVGKAFIKSYCAACLEGAIIVLACVIFSVFAATPPAVDIGAAAVTQVWSYVGELIFNMLVLVGTVKMADRVVREMMGL